MMIRRLGAIAIAAIALASVPAAAQTAGLKFAVSPPWRASAFGDVGGADKLTADNFEISEKGPGEVLLRSSNDRGKIASTSEGIAFYFREIPAGADFRLSAVATVGSFAKNNQVSFGIMLRDKVYANESVKADFGSYLAVGPLGAANAVAQYIFQRGPEGLAKRGDIAKSPALAPGASYKLSFVKRGEAYTLSLGDEEPIAIEGFPAFAGELRYVGLFTSRNATVAFSSVDLVLEE